MASLRSESGQGAVHFAGAIGPLRELLATVPSQHSVLPVVTQSGPRIAIGRAPAPPQGQGTTRGTCSALGVAAARGLRIDLALICLAIPRRSRTFSKWRPLAPPTAGSV